MSRLQKKCLIASGMMHGLLLLVLMLTSAFLMRKEEPIDQPVLNFIPDHVVEAALAHPAAAQPAATPTPPAPAPPQPVARPPQPRTETQPEPKPEPEPEPKPERKLQSKPPPVSKPKPQPREEPKQDLPKRDLPKLESKPAKRPESKPPPKPIVVDLTTHAVDNTAARRQREQEAARIAAESQKFQADKDAALSKLSNLQSKLSLPSIGASSLDMGTVGVSYASYDAVVRQVYWTAWRPPEDMAAGDMVVKVKVVIRKDGTVESATVTEASGVSKLDANIRQLLARVKTIGRAFPDGAREASRTYIIDFNLKAKLRNG